MGSNVSHAGINLSVNRALRKTYGIGICSVEEIGSFAGAAPYSLESKKLPPQSVNGKNGNYGGSKVRDRLCQLIRQHELDANLVKSYAVDFCGTNPAWENRSVRGSGGGRSHSHQGPIFLSEVLQLEICFGAKDSADSGSD